MSESVLTLCNLNTKTREITRRSLFREQQKKKKKEGGGAVISYLSSQKLCDNLTVPLKLHLLRGDNVAVLVGRAPETEYRLSNEIKLFFPHLCRSTGREGKGGGGSREYRWETSALIIDGYWPRAVTDSRKWRFHAVKAASALGSHVHNAAPCQNMRAVAELYSVQLYRKIKESIIWEQFTECEND